MIDSYKGRNLVNGDVVQVYRNLHKGGFSIRCKDTGLVLAHGNNFDIKEPKFVVKTSGRNKVLAEKVKNVHAYIEGIYDGEYISKEKREIGLEVYYNPYKVDKFKVGKEDAKDRVITKLYFKSTSVFEIK